MEENNPIKEQDVKMNFLKKVWLSISKFERYPEMAALGMKNAIIYFTELMLIFSVLVTIIYIYYVNNIAEFEEENLTLSEKIIDQITNIYDDTQMDEQVQILEEYSNNTIVFVILLSVFMSFYLMTIIDVFTLTFFGLFTCLIAKIKINYKSIFNMSIFAMTLSIVLKALYISVNLLTGFEIKYFDMMYISISYICLAAAIFMIKSDFIKQQLELMKIIQESKDKINQTIVVPKRREEEKKDEENEEKQNDVKKEEQEGTEEPSSNA